MLDHTIYKDKTLKQLKSEYKKWEKEVETIRQKCIDDSESFETFMEKSHEMKEKMFFIDKYIRLKETPTVEFGKEWKCELVELTRFGTWCLQNGVTDTNGKGYYATITSKSDIEIKPTDVEFGIVRNDFTHVMWFDNALSDN